MIPLALLTGAIAVAARVAIGHAAMMTGRVDHYYWMLAADAYRTQRGLPVRIADKYLMEDETQAYPPLFGILLGRWHLDRWGNAAVVGLELAQAAVLIVFTTAFHASVPAILLAVSIYAAAPVLVSYNTQLNSRILGDLFLFSMLVAEACAVFVVQSRSGDLALWTFAAVMTALVCMTHKMTLQLYAVLLLPWCWALRTATPLAVMAAGGALYLAFVGPRFAAYQFRAHWDIVRFWNRHWRRLGGHQFRDSPIYGGSAPCVSCFHRGGVRGAIKHLRTVVSYAPVNVALPVASFLTGSWPPAWVVTWLGVTYIWVFATLFVPTLRSLGGGHLYVFNAVAPGAAYVAWLPDNALTVSVLGAGAILTIVSLALAYRVVRGRFAARDAMFDRAASALAAMPRGRVAVFPLQNAEAIAAMTPHAVLWGAHGYGFSRMEGFFPVLTEPLSNVIRRYGITLVLADDRFWSVAESLSREGLRIADEQMFGPWRLTRLADMNAA